MKRDPSETERKLEPQEIIFEDQKAALGEKLTNKETASVQVFEGGCRNIGRTYCFGEKRENSIDIEAIKADLRSVEK